MLPELARESRVDIGLLWVCVVLYAMPVFWPMFFEAPLPLAGARGLLAPWIGVPVWVALVTWTTIASHRAWCKPAALFGGAGFLGAVALGLLIYVSNSAFVGVFACSGALIRLGRQAR